jgi:hypothetical protein
MVNKFITFTTIKNNGRYKNYSNICFFISISDILQNYNISLSPRSLVKLSKFKGHNGEFFDTDKHIDKDLIKLLNYLNIIIFIYPYCPKYKAINPDFYMTIGHVDGLFNKLNNRFDMTIPQNQNKCKLIIPIVCYDNIHFEPIVNTKIPIKENITANNVYKNKYIYVKREYK